MSATTVPKRNVIDELIAERPAFHGQVEQTSLHVQDDVIRWLYGAIPAGSRTLETGCGASTVAFLARGATHTVISPSATEHGRIRDWCHAHAIATDRATFVAATSEGVLPTMDQTPLDFVLIDGSHSFPIPFLDWYYANRRLVRGGLVVIDDTNIHACGVLREFLRAEKGRWEMEADFWRTSVFRKLYEGGDVGEAWTLQPWNRRPATLKDSVKGLAGAVARRTLGGSPALKRFGYSVRDRLTSPKGRRRSDATG